MGLSNFASELKMKGGGKYPVSTCGLLFQGQAIAQTGPSGETSRVLCL